MADLHGTRAGLHRPQVFDRSSVAGPRATPMANREVLLCGYGYHTLMLALLGHGDDTWKISTPFCCERPIDLTRPWSCARPWAAVRTPPPPSGAGVGVVQTAAHGRSLHHGLVNSIGCSQQKGVDFFHSCHRHAPTKPVSRCGSRSHTEGLPYLSLGSLEDPLRRRGRKLVAGVGLPLSRVGLPSWVAHCGGSWGGGGLP